MSFFGIDNNDLENEKRKYLEGTFGDGSEIPVYTWGTEGYDGLGDALHEGGDDLNDETFGHAGPIGKDFDFSQSAFFVDDVPAKSPAPELRQNAFDRDPLLVSRPQATSRPSQVSLGSRWDDRSVSSMLPRANGTGRSGTPGHHPQVQQVQQQRPLSSSAKFSPFGAQETLHYESPHIPHALSQQQIQGSYSGPQPGVARTLEEVEAEMRALAQRSRENIAIPRPVPYPQQQPSPQPQVQLQQLQQRNTPPPRMHPQSQSPRFHQQQQQVLLQQQQQIQQLQQQQQQLQQLREQQQLQEIQEYREQLRMEELERRLRAQHLYQAQQQQARATIHQRQASAGPTVAEIHAAEQIIRRRQQSPASFANDQLEVPFQQSMQYLPQDVQVQQRLLAEAAQLELLQQLKGTPAQIDSEGLRAEAMRKIMEAERMEDKRRRRQAKVAHMSRYNDLMTQSDKDFITRIQVSQLVTQDPYADDYYAQVFTSNLRSRMGINPSEEHIVKFGKSGGVGMGLAQKGSGRRANALQKMESQVARIVQNARLREKEKASLNSLQGALGRTSGRSYKAAPRQLLQVDSTSSTNSDHTGGSATNGNSAGSDLARALNGATADPNGVVKKDPLTYKESLRILEHLYELTMHIDSHRRTIPAETDVTMTAIWQNKDNELVEELWDGWKVMVTLETSKPHPFISLLVPPKGKKLLSRDAQILGQKRMLTMFTLLVACFSQLDVVSDATIIYDTSEATDTFLATVMHTMMLVVAKIPLTPISGLLELLMRRNDIMTICHTRPLIALLTIFLSRVEDLKQTSDPAEAPSQDELDKWQLVFNTLFHIIAQHLLLLFPSTRAAAITGANFVPTPQHEVADQQIWQLLAAIALHSSLEQQQHLVTTLREKILENVVSVNRGWAGSEEDAAIKLANVNIFLHALGLDSSQVVV